MKTRPVCRKLLSKR